MTVVGRREHLMPESGRKTVEVACPRCGHLQPEPPTAYSTLCKKCQAYYRVQEALHPAPQALKAGILQRVIHCFQCSHELEVPHTAASTMCKWCSSHIDLTDYHVTQTVAKSFRTHGRLVIEEKGYVLNTEATVGDAIVKGRLIGRLSAYRTLVVHSSASIKGTFTAGQLIVPAGECFHWPEVIKVGGVDLGGELVADLEVVGIVRLQSGARCFGHIRAGHLVVDAGAVFVGFARIGAKGLIVDG